jgi:hypothetical protein
VKPEQQLALTASHDTYCISFVPITTAAATSQQLKAFSTVPASCTSSNGGINHVDAFHNAAAGVGMDPAASKPAAVEPDAPQPTGVPFVDPAWKAAYDAVSALQSSTAKAATQDPLEYRKLASAALLLAMRPWGDHPAASAASSVGKATGLANGDQQQHATDVGGELRSSDRNSTAVKPEGESAAESAAAGAAGSRCHDGAKQPAADPHHAVALLVRLMS